jgi:hypothetical protein
MSAYKIAAIPQTLIEAVWDKVLPHIARVVELVEDETTVEHVKTKAISGELLILAICNEAKVVAALTLEVRTFDTDMKALYIPMLGGDEFFDWYEQAFEVVKAIAKDFNCVQIRAAGRRGWTKTLKHIGWEEQYVVIKYNVE